jgi:hypothetical protein
MKPIYSSRSKIAGSIDKARRAGIQVATKPRNAIAMTTPVNTSGSRGVARKTTAAKMRLAKIPMSSPATEPHASNFKGRPKAACNSYMRCAPRAMRIPNSFRRLLTAYAAIPKMPLIDNIAPITPSTPRAMAAIREANKAVSSCLFKGST